ncbi:MAG: antitoxin [Actinobacteria bacterium]|nr:antitoxin [Actinomycetota bacterium]
MRTTVTLDPDVAARLRRLMEEGDLSFKEALNATVRAGLDAPAREGTPYRLPTRELRARPGIELDRALALAGELEDEESSRKLELRK